jgi:SpoVK/Ycf46/Vps4 family AAA+-type ATPase
MEKSETRTRTYDLEKLPSRIYQEAAEDLVLAESVRHVLDRYAEYRLRYKKRGYALLGMYGPPGTGKSVTARMAADAAVRQWGESGNLLIVRTPQLYSENLGETPKRIEQLFADIKLSTTSKRITAIIFEDCEGLLMSREQTLANHDPSDLWRATEALLKGLDEVRFQDNLLIYATANHMTGVVDRAAMSRIIYLVPFGLPSLPERRGILGRQLGGRVSEEALEILAAASEGMSGRDLVNLEFKAFVHGTGAPEELTAEAYLAALGVPNGNGSVVRNGNGAHSVSPDDEMVAAALTAAVAGRNGSNGNGEYHLKEETAVMVAELVESPAVVAETIENGKEATACQGNQNGSLSASPPETLALASRSSLLTRLFEKWSGCLSLPRPNWSE